MDIAVSELTDSQRIIALEEHTAILNGIVVQLGEDMLRILQYFNRMGI